MPQYELGFRDYWRIISKRRFILIFTFLTILGITTIYINLQKPVYEAFSTVKVEQRKTVASALMEYITASPGNLLVTQARIIESRFIAEQIARRLDLVKEDMTLQEANEIVNKFHKSISTREVSETNLIQIIVRSSNPQRAALIADEAADVYVEYDLERKIKQTRQVRQFIEKQLATVEARLESTENELKKLKEEGRATGVALSLEDRVTDLQSSLLEMLTRFTEKHPNVIKVREQIQHLKDQLETLPDDELEFVRLTRDLNINEKLYGTFRQKFEEARIAEAEKTGDASIVDYATVPKFPVRPNKKTGSLLGIVLGLLLGLVMSFVVEGMDTSIGTIEDVESLLKLPVLGVVPHVKSEEKRELAWWKMGPLAPKSTRIDDIKVRLIVHDEPKSPIAESYRTLRTNLKLTESNRKTILVTSAGPKEGKTTVMVNLALTAAQMGNKVLLLSTDLRRPALYQTFAIKREPGLSEILSHTIKWQDAVKSLSDMLIDGMGFDEIMKTPGLGNLSVITSGHIPLNPSELLGTKEMSSLMEEVKTKYDVIFFDSPPILPITDAIILAPKVDGVVIVYEIGRTARGALLRAKNQLEVSGAKVLGIVLNHIKPETEMYPTYYPHYYRYRYYGRDKKKGMRKDIPRGEDSEEESEE